MSHTPLPWFLNEEYGRRRIEIVGGEDLRREICGIDLDDDSGLLDVNQCLTDGEFIVRACNSHADLLEALVELCLAAQSARVSKDFPFKEPIEAARAAIAKAKGETQ